MRNLIFFLLLLNTFPHFIYGQQCQIDSLERTLKQEKADTNRVKILNQLTTARLQQPGQDYKKALAFADSAKQLAERISYPKGAFAAYNNLGTIYGYFGMNEKALENYLEELKIAKKIGDTLLINKAHTDMSFMFWSTGDYQKALNEMQIVEDVAVRRNDTAQLINAYWNKSRAYFGLCRDAMKKQDAETATLNYSKTIECYTNALKIVTASKDTAGMFFFMFNLAFVYDKCNLRTGGIDINQMYLVKYEYYQKALETNLNALKLARQLDDDLKVLDCYSHLGLFYRNQGDMSKERGNLPVAENKYRLSLGHYHQAFAIINRLGYRHGIANYNKEVGIAHLKLKNFDSSHIYLAASANIFDEIGFKEGAREGYEKLTEVNYQRGDFKNAFLYYKKFTELKDSMLNESKAKQLMEISVKYEMGKRGDSLDQHRKLIAVQKRAIKRQNNFLISIGALVVFLAGLFVLSKYQSKKIRRQYGEIVQLQSELTHRTTNFFNAIKSMLSVALIRTSDKETITALDKRVNTINHLYKTLFSSSATGFETFGTLLNSICEDFEQSLAGDKNIVIYRKSNAHVSKKEAAPLAFIITELLTNASKHAFENTLKPEIHVEVCDEGAVRKLHVWDNGAGLRDRAADSFGSQQGIDIIKGYCKALDGKMSCRNDNGFHFIMQF